jgi:hypothetical protein
VSDGVLVAVHRTAHVVIVVAARIRGGIARRHRPVGAGDCLIGAVLVVFAIIAATVFAVSRGADPSDDLGNAPALSCDSSSCFPGVVKPRERRARQRAVSWLGRSSTARCHGSIVS